MEEGWGGGSCGSAPCSHAGIQAEGGFLSPLGIDIQVTERKTERTYGPGLAGSTTLFLRRTTEMGFGTSEMCLED